MLVVIAQPNARREALAEEALLAAGFEVEVATCWDEVLALCLEGRADAILVSPHTSRVCLATLMRFCELPHRDRPGLVLWSSEEDRTLAGILGERDRLLGPACTAHDLVAAVSQAASVPRDRLLFPEEIAEANRAGVCAVVGSSSRRCRALVGRLRGQGLLALWASSSDELVVRLYVDDVRLVVVDMGLGDPATLEFGRIARAWNAAVPLVFWTEVLSDALNHQVQALRGRVLGGSAGSEALVTTAVTAGVVPEQVGSIV